MDELNGKRLEEFRQLRQEVRHSGEHLIVGIDIAKDRHHAFFGTATSVKAGDVVFYFTNFRRITFLIPSLPLRATLGIYQYAKNT